MNIRNFSTDKKRLISNFFSLSSVEVANYIFPLITLPYLVRILGPEKYGLIVFSQAFMQYFVLLTDYGFNFSATRNISINRDDKYKVSKIFSSIMTIKIILMILSFCVMATVVFIIPKFRTDWLLYFLTFGMVIGNVIFPVWFFQGMERMKFIAFLNFFSKLIFMVAIFIFVKSTTDYIYVPFLTSLGFITAGVLSLLISWKSFKVRFNLPLLSEVMCELKEGWHVFVSSISTNLYTTTNTFFLGIITNNTVVGYFVAGEKIVKAIIRLFNPIFQSVYPYIVKIAIQSKQSAERKLRKLLFFSMAVSSLVFVLVLIFASTIVKLILGSRFIESIIVIRILSPLIFILPVAYIFANLTLLPFKLDKYFVRIYMSGVFINIPLLMLFIYIFKLNGQGAALSNLITETILTVMLYCVLIKKKIRILYIGHN